MKELAAAARLADWDLPLPEPASDRSDGMAGEQLDVSQAYPASFVEVAGQLLAERYRLGEANPDRSHGRDDRNTVAGQNFDDEGIAVQVVHEPGASGYVGGHRRRLAYRQSVLVG